MTEVARESCRRLSEVEGWTADEANALLDKAREYRARAEEIRRTRARNGDASSSDRSNARDEARASASGSSVVAGAAAVGAAAGFALLGPMSAVIGAGAMAYGTTRKDGWGKACTGAGTAAAASYASLRRLDDEYGLASRASRAARGAARGAKRLNDDYKITERASTAVSASAKAANDFNRRHGVTKNIGRGVAAGVDAVSKSFSSSRDASTTDALPSAPAS